MEEYTREPPFRIGDDTGSAFAMGLVGGSIFQAFTGYKNAAKGQKLVSTIFLRSTFFSLKKLSAIFIEIWDCRKIRSIQSLLVD
uniref:Uncharacterized protein n=1 Tax=Heterorhabditis bacteriophora TaxID=37862 RepID=A0A1I7WJ10_HETBA